MISLGVLSDEIIFFVEGILAKYNSNRTLF